MARPTSFGKRENEKKKQAKRLEKQKKKEQRKASGKDSFEDMIAYVDQNGMITDTPQDLTEREEINSEDIAISTQKKEMLEEASEYHGRIEHFNDAKGYGFVKDKGSIEKYFFHISNCTYPVAKGDDVIFELEDVKRNQNAVNIRPDKKS